MDYEVDLLGLEFDFLCTGTEGTEGTTGTTSGTTDNKKSPKIENREKYDITIPRTEFDPLPFRPHTTDSKRRKEETETLVPKTSLHAFGGVFDVCASLLDDVTSMVNTLNSSHNVCSALWSCC